MNWFRDLRAGGAKGRLNPPVNLDKIVSLMTSKDGVKFVYDGDSECYILWKFADDEHRWQIEKRLDKIMDNNMV